MFYHQVREVKLIIIRKPTQRRWKNKATLQGITPSTFVAFDKNNKHEKNLYLNSLFSCNFTIRFRSFDVERNSLNSMKKEKGKASIKMEYLKATKNSHLRSAPLLMTAQTFLCAVSNLMDYLTLYVESRSSKFTTFAGNESFLTF